MTIVEHVGKNGALGHSLISLSFGVQQQASQTLCGKDWFTPNLLQTSTCTCPVLVLVLVLVSGHMQLTTGCDNNQTGLFNETGPLLTHLVVMVMSNCY